jgi:hypothetical protein
MSLNAVLYNAVMNYTNEKPKRVSCKENPLLPNGNSRNGWNIPRRFAFYWHFAVVADCRGHSTPRATGSTTSQKLPGYTMTTWIYCKWHL